MPKPTKLPATRWEYRDEYCRNAYMPKERLAELGRLGWELCATVATPDRSGNTSSGWPAVVVFYFKRQLK